MEAGSGEAGSGDSLAKPRLLHQLARNCPDWVGAIRPEGAMGLAQGGECETHEMKRPPRRKPLAQQALWRPISFHAP
jgi:hypothetical protein